MKLGIRAHDLGRLPAQQLIESLKDHHFHFIQLVLAKAIESDQPQLLIDNELFIKELSQALKSNEIEVAMLGAYFNPVHSNKKKVAQTVDYFKKHLKMAKQFHTTLVGTETGSYNDDQWTFHEKNSSEEAFLEVKKVFSELLPVAKEEGIYLAIEPAYQHVISSPQRLRRLLDELNHDHIRVTFDLFNLLSIHTYQNQHAIVDEMIELFNEDIRVIHAKDFIIENGTLKQVAPGQGLLDYPYLLEKISQLPTDPIIIFEGVVGEDIQRSTTFLKNLTNHNNEGMS